MTRTRLALAILTALAVLSGCEDNERVVIRKYHGDRYTIVCQTGFTTNEKGEPIPIYEMLVASQKEWENTKIGDAC